jgi:beta-lactamase regulating signal transducer with metallopeptidase domain/HEAT repeat protein
MTRGIAVLNAMAGPWMDWMMGLTWQVALLTGVVWLVARIMRRNAASVRYLLWLIVFIKLVLPPVLGTPWSVGNYIPATELQGKVSQFSPIVSAPVMESTEALPLVTTAPEAESMVSTDTISIAPTMATWLMLAWGLVAVVLLAVVGLQYIWYRHCMLRAIENAPESLRALLEEQGKALGMRRGVLLQVSRELSTPAVFGIWRPRILLPAGCEEQFTRNELSNILGHELAHVKRGDLLVGWITGILTCLYWFHPAVWVAGLNLRREREMACDDAALRTKQNEEPDYASTMLHVAESFTGNVPAGAGFLGLIEVSENLLHRIRSIGDTKRRRRLGWRSGSTLVVIMAVLLPMGAWSKSSGPTARIMVDGTEGLNALTMMLKENENLRFVKAEAVTPERLMEVNYIGEDVDIFEVTFGTAGSFVPSAEHGMLDEFNRLHPRGVRTHHFRDDTPSRRHEQPQEIAKETVETEIRQYYSKADPEVQEYIRWTARTFGRSQLWLEADAFSGLSAQELEAKIVYTAEVLQGDYGRHLCIALAEAGALKDKRLLPGLIQVATYHRENSNYDCRPKWMGVAALGRQDEISAVPHLVDLVDHGNQNTRMWARASLSRLTGQNFDEDKKAWAQWWNMQGKEPQVDVSALKPWTGAKRPDSQGVGHSPEDLAANIVQRKDPALREKSLVSLREMLAPESSIGQQQQGLTALLGSLTAKFDREPFRAPVVALLESDDAHCRALALRCLPSLEATHADLALLLPMVKDVSSEVRENVGVTLKFIDKGEHGEQVIPALMELLNDADSQVVVRTLRGMWGEYTSPEFDALLIELSHDERYRGYTIYHALSTMQSKSVAVCERLIEELDNPDWNDSGRAAWGLGYGVVKEAYSLVEEGLLTALPEEMNNYTRREEFEALSVVATEKSRPYLQSVVDSELETEEFKKQAKAILEHLAGGASVEDEIRKYYSKAHPEVQEYIRWTSRNFGRSQLWLEADAFSSLSAQDREVKILYAAKALKGEYGRHLCTALAEAGVLKDKKLLPGLIQVATYHHDDRDYDCRPKWMGVAALGRQDDISAVPHLVNLVDHGNQNTRMWARASLSRLTDQNFNDDKKGWARWWNAQGHEPRIDVDALKPWTLPGDLSATSTEAPEPDLLQQAEALYAANKRSTAPDKSEKLAEAIALYETYQQQHPTEKNAGHALMMVGICYDWMGEPEKSLKAFEGAVKLYPEVPGYSEATWYYLGSAYQQAGEEAKALDAYRKCADLCSTGPKGKAGFPYASAMERISKLTGGDEPSAAAAAAPPELVSTSPAIGASDVDPATMEIRVVFDRPMGGGFSWTGGGDNFPETAGKPSWSVDKKTCTLPVRLKANWSYRLGLNSPSHKNFKSAEGVPLDPVRWTFSTAN